MTAWAAYRRFGIGAVALTLVVVSGARAADPEPPRLTPAQLRTKAAEAEKAGDWDTAFNLYCHLYITDRSAPDLREKLNNALRHVQQLRRHRDPAYRNFASTLQRSDALNLYAELMHKVPQVFGDPDRSAPQSLWAYGVEEFDRALGNPVFQAEFLENPSPERIQRFRIALRMDWAKRPIRNAKEARSTLNLLIGTAQDECPLRVPAAVVFEFICGACTGLDEYTVYLNPEMVTPNLASPDLTEYGVYLTWQNGELLVDGVATGSWAVFNTNLRKGDRITRINGRTMWMAGPVDAADALRHPPGMFHELETNPVCPDGETTLSRLPLTIPTVYAAQIVSPKEGVGYVRVGSIQPPTPREIDQAVTDLRARGMRVLVLDLRGNHGGNFLAGVEVARRFLPAGVIVTTQGQLGDVSNRVFSSDSGATAIDVPLVVMIDTETASAAEVVAAALKDNNRATLVGMPTFGKGSVQYPLRLGALDDPSDPVRLAPRSGSVRVTIAKLLSPRGVPINGVGVTPQVLEPEPRCQDEMAVQQALDLLRPGPERVRD
jgi:C-terminal peptidase prc